MQAGAVAARTELPHAAGTEGAEPSSARIERLVRDQFSFVWRTLRRFGLERADADDATQQVFMIVAQKIEQIQPESERSFLFGTAVRIASRARRSLKRRREDVGDAGLDERHDPSADLDSLLDQHRARLLLDEVLEQLSDDLRAVFVLYEIEQLKMAEIAEILEVPMGTVASRLRRAREAFDTHVRRVQAAAQHARERAGNDAPLHVVDGTEASSGGGR